MTDLVTFLRARLADDERIALAATFEETHPRGNHWRWGEILADIPAPAVRDGYLRSNGGLSATVSLVTVETYDAEGRPFPAEVLHSASRVHAEVANHIARHDPARVLAEAVAKHAIIDLHVDRAECTRCEWFDDELYPCDTLKLLACVYASHPDYRKEWTP